MNQDCWILVLTYIFFTYMKWLLEFSSFNNQFLNHYKYMILNPNSNSDLSCVSSQLRPASWWTKFGIDERNWSVHSLIHTTLLCIVGEVGVCTSQPETFG
ncbi:hypothetical protein O6H91_Y399900 [Diphasiastrum complanatum]|nr:hypothetical protein O6H91_Y399900 [Diphasiastrum complanatum]